MNGLQSDTARAQAKLMQGTHSASGEVMDYSFYDSQSLLSTALEHRFFTQGVGKPFTVAAVGNKTLADSNVKSDGIPNGQRFTVKAIKCLYYCHALAANAVIQNIIDLYSRTVIQFKIDGKDEILTLKLSELAGLNFSVINVPTVAGDQIGTHQMNIIRSAYPLNVPIVLASLTRYEVLMQHTAAPAAGLDTDRITLSLQGLLERLS